MRRLLDLELQKLLVPTPGKIEFIDGTPTLLSGFDNPDIGVIGGLLQSFYDAPGVMAEDEDGNYVLQSDGTYEVVKGTKLKEELAEINIAAGIEYWYNDIFALRTGFFYENANKGARQYFNFGLGFKYNKFGIDISYLAALKRLNPLANTLRFTLSMVLGDDGSKPNIEE